MYPQQPPAQPPAQPQLPKTNYVGNGKTYQDKQNPNIYSILCRVDASEIYRNAIPHQTDPNKMMCNIWINMKTDQNGNPCPDQYEKTHSVSIGRNTPYQPQQRQQRAPRQNDYGNPGYSQAAQQPAPNPMQSAPIMHEHEGSIMAQPQPQPPGPAPLQASVTPSQPRHTDVTGQQFNPNPGHTPDYEHEDKIQTVDWDSQRG